MNDFNEELDQTTNDVETEPTFNLSIEGAAFLKRLIMFAASQGGFDISLYQQVYHLNETIDAFLAEHAPAQETNEASVEVTE